MTNMSSYRLKSEVISKINSESLRLGISKSAYISAVIMNLKTPSDPIVSVITDPVASTIGTTPRFEQEKPINELQQAIQDSGLQAVLDDRTPDYELEEGQPNEATRYQISRQVKLATDVREVWRIATKYKIKPQ